MQTKPFSLLAATLVAGSLVIAPLQPVGANPPIPAQQADGLGPVETLGFLAENLANKRADAFWVLLPTSYRDEITALMHQFANEVDADVYQQSADVLKKVVRLMQEKKDLILGFPMLAEMLDDEQSEIGYGAIVSVLGMLVSSELGNLERLKTVDPGAMLAETGSGLMKEMEKVAVLLGDDDPFIQFKDPVFELVSQEGDSATVKVVSTELENGEAVESVTELNLTKVEDRWIESEMAASFGEGMQEAKAAIDDMDWQEGKMAALTLISGVDSTLDELLATNTQDEFNASVMALLGGFMGGFPDQE